MIPSTKKGIAKQFANHVFWIFDEPQCSGGPLLDSKGHMIGINAAIFTQTGKINSISQNCASKTYGSISTSIK